MHAAIPKKNQKYPSTTILKHANVFAKVNKLPICVLTQCHMTLPVLQSM